MEWIRIPGVLQRFSATYLVTALVHFPFEKMAAKVCLRKLSTTAYTYRLCVLAVGRTSPLESSEGFPILTLNVFLIIDARDLELMVVC